MKRVGGGRRKEKARVHELVRGFGHPRANDRTDAANQGDAVQSELRNRTNREFTEPVHEPVRQFAAANSKGCKGEAVAFGASDFFFQAVSACCRALSRRALIMAASGSSRRKKKAPGSLLNKLFALGCLASLLPLYYE